MPMTRNDARSSVQIRKLTYSALYLAIALALPFLTGQIPEIGSMLCPMHIPALLCGFVCGWPWGLAVGFVSPLLRSLLFGMPTAYTAAAMAFELAAYGAVSGILYRIFPRRNWSVYVTLIAAMIVGRLVWGCGQFMMAGLQHTAFDRSLFLAGAVTNALPGILVQIILIPILVITMEKAKLTLNGTRIRQKIESAKKSAAVCTGDSRRAKEDPSNTDGSSFQIAVSGRSSAKCSLPVRSGCQCRYRCPRTRCRGRTGGFRRVRSSAERRCRCGRTRCSHTGCG